MHRPLTLTVLLIMACLLTAGCQTYINIPPQEGDAANHDPNGKSAREVMVLAIRAALDDARITGPVQVMLPGHTNKLTYAHVVSAVGDQAISPHEEDVQSVVGVVFAKGVRVRGTRGEVDVIRPIGDGIDQLVTVYMTWRPVSNWSVDSVHAWRGVPIDK